MRERQLQDGCENEAGRSQSGGGLLPKLSAPEALQSSATEPSRKLGRLDAWFEQVRASNDGVGSSMAHTEKLSGFGGAQNCGPSLTPLGPPRQWERFWKKARGDFVNIFQHSEDSGAGRQEFGVTLDGKGAQSWDPARSGLAELLSDHGISRQTRGLHADGDDAALSEVAWATIFPTRRQKLAEIVFSKIPARGKRMTKAEEIASMVCS